MTPRRILIGKILGAHGLKGDVKIASYCEQPEDIFRYVLTDKSGEKSFSPTFSGGHGGALIARLSGVSDRNQAELLKGTELYMTRDQLPELAEGEYYWEDLTDLEVRDADGSVLGRVKSVQDYGAGILLEVEMQTETLILPFIPQFFPEIHIAEGFLIMNQPEIVEAKGE